MPETAKTVSGLRSLAGIAGIRDFPKIAERLESRRWPDERIRKVLGADWCRVLGDVWSADRDAAEIEAASLPG